MANTYKNAAVVLTSTGATDLYTAPANTRAIVQSVNVANIDGSDRYATVTWYDSSAAASYTLVYNALIPGGTAINAIDAPIVLEPGDIVRVQASAANTLHATASILQIDSSSSLPDAAVTTAKIADSAITSAKMATGVSPTIICTSSTRPGSPFEGQTIYETDTKRTLTYDGTGWYAFNQVVGKDEKTSTKILTSSQTTFQDEDLSASVTYGANRVLRITLNVRPYPAGGLQGMSYRVLRGSTVVAYWGLEPATLQSGTAAPVTLVYMSQTPSSGATETFKVQFKANTSNTSVESYATATSADGARQMMIEDIGPA